MGRKKWDVVKLARYQQETGYTYAEIARAYGVSRQQVTDLCRKGREQLHAVLSAMTVPLIPKARERAQNREQREKERHSPSYLVRCSTGEYW